MKLDVPYYSQYKDVSLAGWQQRACGVVALAMVLGYHNVLSGDIDSLIQEGLQKDAYLQGVGWKHEGLASIARGYGIEMYRKEYNESSEGAVDIVEHLKQNAPVLVSLAGAYYGKPDSHIVCLTGYAGDDPDIEGLYYHDPQSQETPAQHAYMDIATFKDHWRKMAIFVAQ